MDLSSSLNDLYLLSKVIDAGGFTAAAVETGLSKSRLSRRIIELEQRLGICLLQRTTRSFSVTPIGEEIYRHTQDMLKSLKAVESTIQEFQGEPSGVLRLVTPPILESLVSELLAEFAIRYPKVRIVLNPGNSLRELLTQKADLVFGLGEGPANSAEVVVHTLANIDIVCVGSPALVEQLGPNRQPESIDPERFLCLGPAHTPQAWQLQGVSEHFQPRPTYIVNSLTALKAAAHAGIGLAQLPLYACLEDLRVHSLRRTLESFEPPASPLYAMSPPSRMITLAVRTLLQFLRQRLSSRAEQGIKALSSTDNTAPHPVRMVD